MGILPERCMSWFYLGKVAMCVLTLVNLLTYFVLYYTPILQEDDFLVSSQGPFNSTCSHAADRRGLNQRIISYSIYGNFSQEDHVERYLILFQNTLKSIPSKYPGWTVRIYHNLTIDDTNSWETFNNHLKMGSHVDFCNVTEVIANHNLGTNLFAMTWRWFPMLDEMVDTVMSRDSDSPVIPREEDSVREWLASDRIFHIMRDHPFHCTSILGGMWGVKLSQDRPRITGTFHKIFTMNHNQKHGYDQDLLTDYIWPIAQLNMVSHDSYCCGNFPFSRPFPTPRKDGLFIGGRDTPSVIPSCPVQCRPVNATSEWDSC